MTPLAVTLSGAPLGAESKGLDITELAPSRFARVLANTTVGTPRFRCAPLGVTPAEDAGAIRNENR